MYDLMNKVDPIWVGGEEDRKALSRQVEKGMVAENNIVCLGGRRHTCQGEGKTLSVVFMAPVGFSGPPATLSDAPAISFPRYVQTHAPMSSSLRAASFTCSGILLPLFTTR